MALILEVLGGRDEVRQRVRPDSFPFTIGRGYGSDLILDDPYVDASHARIVREENGDCYIEDAGSLNGLGASDGTRSTRIRLESGTTLRLGRTTLRACDSADAVPPALRDGDRPARLSLAALGRLGQAGVIAGGAAVFALVMWLSSYDRTSLSDQLAGLLAFLLLGSLWAGGWAIASRVTRHRFHMLEHLAIISAAVTVVMLLSGLDALVLFFLPAHWFGRAVGILDGVVLTAVVLTAHLAYASRMSLRRRATIAFSISAALVALGLTMTFAKADDYTDVPSFVSTLAPISAKLIPAAAPAELQRAAASLRPAVDALKKDD